MRPGEADPRVTRIKRYKAHTMDARGSTADSPLTEAHEWQASPTMQQQHKQLRHEPMDGRTVSTLL